MESNQQSEEKYEYIEFKPDKEIQNFFGGSTNHLGRNNFIDTQGQDNIKRLKDFTLSLRTHRTDWTNAKAKYLDNNEIGISYYNNAASRDIDLEVTNSALGQICNTRKVPLKSSYLNSLDSSLDWKDPKGESHNLPIKMILLNELFSTRSKDFIRNFREVKKSVFGGSEKERIVVGVVGRNYPLDYSDYKQVNSISNHLNDLGVDFKFGQSSISENGDVKFSWRFTADQDLSYSDKSRTGFELRHNRGVSQTMIDENMPKNGIYYYNNFSGMGSMKVTHYSYQEWCSNGSISAMISQITGDIEHMNLDNFVKKLSATVFSWSDNQIEKFEKMTGLDFNLPRELNYTNYIIDGKKIKDQLYDLVSKNIIFKTFLVGEKVQQKYIKSAELILNDWQKELEAIAHKQSLSDKAINELKNVAIFEPTILLKEDEPQAEYTALIDTFSAAANFYENEDRLGRATLYRETAGNLLARASQDNVITSLLTI
ncbi:MAG: hypothetical protein ACXAC2_00265 [Candidatus Kariarchaeaceae archaeon]